MALLGLRDHGGYGVVCAGEPKVVVVGGGRCVGAWEGHRAVGQLGRQCRLPRYSILIVIQ